MRYQAIDESQSGHCCFNATVVDTTKLEIINGEQRKDLDGRFLYEIVCECFNLKDAQLICDALNAKDAMELPELEDEVEVCWDKKGSFMSDLIPLITLELPKL